MSYQGGLPQGGTPGFDPNTTPVLRPWQSQDPESSGHRGRVTSPGTKIAALLLSAPLMALSVGSLFAVALLQGRRFQIFAFDTRTSLLLFAAAAVLVVSGLLWVLVARVAPLAPMIWGLLTLLIWSAYNLAPRSFYAVTGFSTRRFDIYLLAGADLLLLAKLLLAVGATVAVARRGAQHR